jgi:hypothetical protein
MWTKRLGKIAVSSVLLFSWGETESSLTLRPLFGLMISVECEFGGEAEVVAENIS